MAEDVPNCTPTSITTICHPSMDRSAFVGAVGSSTKGPRQGSCSPEHQVIGRQPSVPAVARELAPAPLGHSPGNPGEHSCRQWPTDKRAFVEIQVSCREVLAHFWSKKNPMNLDTLEIVRGQFDFTNITPPQGGTAQRQETFLAHNFSCRRKWEGPSSHTSK